MDRARPTVLAEWARVERRRVPYDDVHEAPLRRSMRTRALSWSGLPLLVATWLVALDVRADAVAPLELTWSAPADCPSRAEVESSIARLLAGSRSAETLGADVRVTVDRRGLYHARLRTHLHDADGERSLTAGTCPLVASATALVLALTIDPTLAVDPQEPEPSPPPPAPPPPSTPPPPEPRDVSAAPAPAAPRAGSTLTFAPGAAALIDVGSLPSAAIGGAVELAVGKGWATLRADWKQLVQELCMEVCLITEPSRISWSAITIRSIRSIKMNCSNFRITRICGDRGPTNKSLIYQSLKKQKHESTKYTGTITGT